MESTALDIINNDDINNYEKRKYLQGFKVDVEHELEITKNKESRKYKSYSEYLSFLNAEILKLSALIKSAKNNRT